MGRRKKIKRKYPTQLKSDELRIPSASKNLLETLTQPPLEPLPTIGPDDPEQFLTRIEQTLQIFGLDLYNVDRLGIHYQILLKKARTLHEQFSLPPGFYTDSYRVLNFLSASAALVQLEYLYGKTTHLESLEEIDDMIHLAFLQKEVSNPNNRLWATSPTNKQGDPYQAMILEREEYKLARQLSNVLITNFFNTQIRATVQGKQNLLNIPLRNLELSQPLFKNKIKVFALQKSAEEFAKLFDPPLEYASTMGARVGLTKSGQFVIMLFGVPETFNGNPASLTRFAKIFRHEFTHTQGDIVYLGGHHGHLLYLGLNEAATEIFAQEEPSNYADQRRVIEYLGQRIEDFEALLRQAYRFDRRDGIPLVNAIVNNFGLDSLVFLALMKGASSQEFGLEATTVLNILKFKEKLKKAT